MTQQISTAKVSNAAVNDATIDEMVEVAVDSKGTETVDHDIDLAALNLSIGLDAGLAMILQIEGEGSYGGNSAVKSEVIEGQQQGISGIASGLKVDDRNSRALYPYYGAFIEIARDFISKQVKICGADLNSSGCLANAGEDLYNLRGLYRTGGVKYGLDFASDMLLDLSIVIEDGQPAYRCDLKEIGDSGRRAIFMVSIEGGARELAEAASTLYRECIYGY